MAEVSPLSLDSLLPHRGPARLLEEILAVRPDGCDCLGRIPHTSPFVTDGRAPAFVGLEMAAQAAAAFEALGRRSAGQDPQPRIGYLVGVREARFLVAELAADRPFRASVTLAGSAPPLAMYDVRIDSDGIECLHATISTYVA